MESWKQVFHQGVAPQLSTEQLQLLARALRENDETLIQGATTMPPPLHYVQDWPVEAACLIGYCGWKGLGLETVAEVEEYFCKVCFDADQAMGEPAAIRYLTNFWDESPRTEIHEKLLSEVEAVLSERTKEAA